MSLRKAVTKASSNNAIPAALRKLSEKGYLALLPEKMMNSNNPSNNFPQSSKRVIYKRPIVSKRIAKTLRKKAIKDGTFGTYDAVNGVGWDIHWDKGLFHHKTTNTDTSTDTTTTNTNTTVNSGKVNYMEIRGYKDTKRVRTRESRAIQIEQLLSTADEKIVQYRQTIYDNKPEGGIEHAIKKMIQKAGKKK